MPCERLKAAYDWARTGTFEVDLPSSIYCSLTLVPPSDIVALCYFDRKIRSQTIYFRIDIGINLCFRTKL